MATGLEGAALIATDATVSIVMGVVKITVFGGISGVLTSTDAPERTLPDRSWVAVPCTFLARLIVKRLPVHVHTAMLDVVVIVGGTVMIFGALRR